MAGKIDRGFSLVELLVALTIMSLTVLIGSYAYSTFSNKWGQDLGRFNQSFYKAKQNALMPRLMRGIFPYVVENTTGNARIYFEGNSDGFVGVVQNAMFDVSTPAVVRFSVNQDPNFSYSLTYEEWLMYREVFISLEQDFDFTHQFIVLDGYSDIQFEYFGWYSNEVKAREISAPIGEKDRGWYRNYNSLEKGLLPEKIKVILSNGDKKTHWEFALVDQHPKWLLWNDGRNDDI
ncbi:PilW family protein [Shewanella aestuarii]|uniref:Prepilin-type N-terminal cleavage/methylation domain-containing protein n=1 Tax=Shewanella aestuarii TaxID=1028752 RepID=A0A6G9QM55_9GAMM|nr:prepilin-type N-terminal cleavage/methylation domain-containing protein [Shewanella aestuarii]QIR15145.1 prepilin-type N-terminal cleavage/methylation domain-containing protein [Shewanella aestuarii]